MTEQPQDGQQRTVPRRALGPLCAALLLLGTAVGCSSDNPAPQPLDQSTEAASSTPSETPEPADAPTLPPEAKGTSDKAAIAFVEHVIEVLNYTARTLDTRHLSRLSSPDCEACNAISASSKDIRSSGGSIRGGSWSPVETNALVGGSTDLTQVQAVVDCAPQVVRREKGGELTRHPGGRKVYVFDLGRSSSGWRVLSIRGGSS